MVYKIVSIADIHFGSLDPAYTYEILQKQFIEKIKNLDFNICAICGDLFHAKYMSNNPIISYTLSFIDELVNLCYSKRAPLILLSGTQSHDNGQLKLFYHYLAKPELNVYIVEDIKFIDINGLRILCIPEKYGIKEEEYRKILFESGGYDICLLHGTFQNSFHGTEISTLNSTHTPIFSMNSFINCGGPILMGHYHIAGCYGGYAYYNGSPLRWQHGEESDKGFLLTLYDNINRIHYTELIPIESYRYITLDINDILNKDPREIVSYVLEYKKSHNIDYIRLVYNDFNSNMNVVQNYFRTNPYVSLYNNARQDRCVESINNTITQQQSQYSYIVDNNIDDYSKFVMYINQSEGKEFITVEELMHLLED